MYRCEICNTILLKRNKTKYNQTKKHKFYSNLILNRSVIKNVEVIKVRDIFNPYFIEHTKKLNLFTVCIFLRFDDDEDPRNHNISVSNNVTHHILSGNHSTFTTELASDFFDRFIPIYLSHKCDPKMIQEIEIVFISDPKDIIQEHFLKQPKSMLCRELIGKFHESTQDFECKWLPDSFKIL